jgi:hypothetical protein
MKREPQEFVIDFTTKRTETEWRFIFADFSVKFTDIVFKFLSWLLVCGAFLAAHKKTLFVEFFIVYLFAIALLVNFLWQFFAYRLYIKFSNNANIDLFFNVVVGVIGMMMAYIIPYRISELVSNFNIVAK